MFHIGRAGGRAHIASLALSFVFSAGGLVIDKPGHMTWDDTRHRIASDLGPELTTAYVPDCSLAMSMVGGGPIWSKARFVGKQSWEKLFEKWEGKRVVLGGDSLAQNLFSTVYCLVHTYGNANISNVMILERNGDSLKENKHVGGEGFQGIPQFSVPYRPPLQCTDEKSTKRTSDDAKDNVFNVANIFCVLSHVDQHCPIRSA